MADAIGALAVRLSADAAELLAELKKSDTALGKTGERFMSATKLAAGFATGLAGVGAALFAVTKSAANVADEFGKLSQKTGVSVESLSALSHAAKLSNVSMDGLNTGLRHLARHMAEAGEGGVSVEEKLLAVADQFAGMEDGAGKTALAMQLFGKSGADLIPLLNEGRAGIEAMREEAKRLGVVISTDMARQAQEFNDNLTRLQGVLEGVKIEIAKGLLPALTSMSSQMLDGIRISGGFGQALLELGGINPFRSLGGNIRELTADLEKLLQSRDQFAQMKGYEQQVAQINKTIDVTERRIAFLKSQQQREALTLSGPDTLDARDLMAHPPKQNPAAPPAEVDWKDRAFVGQQIQEGMDEEQRIRGEAFAIMAQQRDAFLANERALEQQRIQAIMDAADREQEVAIENGRVLLENSGLSHTMKLEQFRTSLLTEEQLAIEQHEKKLEQLSQFTEEELAALGGRDAIKERMERDHMERMRQIRGRGLDVIQKMVDAFRAGDLRDATSYMAQATAGLAAHSRKMFELNKAAGIANAVINAYQGISRTLAEYPFPLSAAMAAAQAGLAFAQVQAIRSSTFGGGGGAAPSLAGSTPATPVTPVQSGAPGGDVPGQTVIINLQGGDMFSGAQMRKLFEQINEHGRDGGRIAKFVVS